MIRAGFEGTPLYSPINTFVYCILGSKIDSLEKGLTWVSEHAHIDLPTLPADVLQLSPESTQELASPISAAAVGEPDSPDSGAIAKLVRHFEDALRAEQMVYGILLGAYGLLVLVGLAVVLWHSGGREAWERRSLGCGKGGNGDDGGGLSASSIHPAHTSFTPLARLYDSYRAAGSITRAPPPPEKDDKDAAPTTSNPGSDGSGSLRKLAAPGAAFLNMRGFLSTPTPSRSPTPAPPPPLKDKGHPWAPLPDAGQGQEPANHGFWVTRAVEREREADAEAMQARHSRTEDPFDDNHSPPPSGVSHRFSNADYDSADNTDWGSAWRSDSAPNSNRNSHDITATTAGTTLLTPRSATSRRRPAPPKMTQAEWDEVDALAASRPSKAEVTRAAPQAPSGEEDAVVWSRVQTPPPQPSSLRLTPSPSPQRGIGSVLQHIQDRRASRKQRIEDEERIDPFISPSALSSLVLPPEVGR